MKDMGASPIIPAILGWWFGEGNAYPSSMLVCGATWGGLGVIASERIFSSRKLNQSASMRRLLCGFSDLSGFLVERNEPAKLNKPDQPEKPAKAKHEGNRLISHLEFHSGRPVLLLSACVGCLPYPCYVKRMQHSFRSSTLQGNNGRAEWSMF